MNRKIIKILSIILVFSLLFAVFALTACANRSNPPPQPRELDDFEKSIVGTWRDSENWGYDFNSDGTYTTTNGHKGEFFHIENRVINNRNCEIIKCVSDVISIRAVFDDEPDTLYGVYDGVIAVNADPCKRKTNNEESDENQELLNLIKQKLAGEWKYYNDEDNYITFTSDGAFARSSGATGKIKLNGEAEDDIFGHYYEIKLDGDILFRLYDFSDNSLYLGHTASYTKSGAQRKLHSSETRIVGVWQEYVMSSRQYTFGTDGKYTYTANSGKTYTYDFFIGGEGTNSKGHYYIYTFPDASMLDWIIYDNDLDTARQRTGGAVFATRVI